MKILFLAALIFVATTAHASKIQQQGIKTHSDCVAAGAADAVCLPLTSQIYDSLNAQRLSTTLTNGAVGSGSATSGQVLTANGSGGTSFQTPTTGNPPGTVVAFAGSTCPTGTVSTDGSSLLRAGTYASLFSAIGTTYGSVDGTHFTLPNTQGTFLRGVGAQTISGVTYTGTQGLTQGDQLQGHIHTGGVSGYTNGVFGGNAIYGSSVNNANTGSPTSDGTNGTPRTGAETRPANIVVRYCIYY